MKIILSIIVLVYSFSFSIKAQVTKPVKPASVLVIKMREGIDSAMDEQDYALALKKCDALLKISPMDSVALQRKVGAFFYLGKFDECIAQTPKAFKNKDTAAYMLGYLSLQNQGEDIDSATIWNNRNKMANAGLSLNPKDAYCNASKAILMSEAKNNDSSYIYIDLSVENADKETKPWARVLKAALYHDDNKKVKCYEELNSTITEFPEYENAYIQLVQIYRSDYQFEKALIALAQHSEKFNLEQEDKDLKFYILRDAEKKEEACLIAQDLGTENSYVFDEAVKLGCTWMYATLKNNDGGEYIYEVDNLGEYYDFTVTKTSGSYKGNFLDLSWNMSSKEDMLGTLVITKDALDTAHEQMNQFSHGDLVLTNKTSVWISRAVFNELVTKGESYINADGKERLYKVATTEDEKNYLASSFTPSIQYNGDKGKIVKMIHIFADDESGYEIWINDDADNPQIIKMDLGWTIELKEVTE